MQRREFLASGAVGIGLSSQLKFQTADAAENTSQSDNMSGVFFGAPVLSGPAPESLSILQAVNGPASGYLEIAVGEEPFRRIDHESHGLLPYDDNVLKFVLPPLPANQVLRYRIIARKIHFETDYKIHQGPVESTPVQIAKTLNPAAASTRFVIWNDTHEHQATIQKLQQQTAAIQPDFLMWNGDQTNNVHDPRAMREQYLSPGQLEISARWPLAYARGNHDVRGPAARIVDRFTGTPEDRFYYAFRSGPLAALVMDTGEDKPDDRDVFAGLAAFEPMRRRQQTWLKNVIEEPWFKSAPFRVLFCHIPLWWHEDTSKYDFWFCSEVCREAWLPLLIRGGVQVVISGHTHRATWYPATADQPIAQLIGGGPQLDRARLIEGNCDGKTLTLTTRLLDGTIAHEARFEA